MNNLSNNSKLPAYSTAHTFKSGTVGEVQNFAQKLFSWFGVESQQIDTQYHKLGPSFSNKPLSREMVDELVTHQQFQE